MLSSNSCWIPSQYITHLNCHYTGERASIVLHSDKAAAAFVLENGWADEYYH
jgi:hypothetical protein